MTACLSAVMHTDFHGHIHALLINFSLEAYIIIELKISIIFRFASLENFHTSGNMESGSSGNIQILQIW